MFGSGELLWQNPQLNEFFVGKLLQPVGAAQQFQVIEFFVRGNFAGLRDGYGVGEQHAAAIARVTDAPRDFGAPGEPRGVESVLQQQRHLELFGAKFGGQPFATGKTRVNSLYVVGD